MTTVSKGVKKNAQHLIRGETNLRKKTYTKLTDIGESRYEIVYYDGADTYYAYSNSKEGKVKKGINSSYVGTSLITPSNRYNSTLSTGITKVNGKEYYSETGVSYIYYSDSDHSTITVTLTYCFEGDNIRYFIVDQNNGSRININQILAFQTTCDESKFVFPEGFPDEYTFTLKN